MDDSYIPIQDRKQHPTLWFDDGNIVLTTNISRFRVHRGLLSMNSPVFADMLSMPQPDRIEDGYEGLPVVEISDNDADFTHLLRFFYDHRYYQGGTETTFEKVSGLLRMSTKYQVDDLRTEIIAHLSLAYPSTLEHYMKAVDPDTQLPLFPPFHGQHFAVVHLARETDASILLPAALWRSMCMTTPGILEGTVDSNGTRHMLPPGDIRICMLTKSQIYKKLVRMESMLTKKGRLGCVRQQQNGGSGVAPCTEIATSSVINHFASPGLELVDDNDMFAEMKAFEKWRHLVCHVCRHAADSTLSSHRTRWWSALPLFFGLPEWNNSQNASN
ncbi:hypothetical protein BD410DRAFT_776904 [Rickenella mellea]|uniref:BTB domain-containing protein n=1 Tax=Rickenella mellea TaxID=50990 RepID=A0A4Y7PMM6_9AGAM|nr:hypothetical protein BD410DRAFT_776904 [Rickenella mellea]